MHWQTSTWTCHNMIRKMLSFMVILTLALHACLSELDMLYPDQPCTEAENQNAYDTFLHRHLRKDTPTDPRDLRKWQKFILKIKRNRETRFQSFFPFSEARKVLAVCSSGGKMYTGNLCISKKPLKFFTAEINSRTWQVKKVKVQKQHVILACDKIKIENKCLPVHFHGNYSDAKPEKNKPNCSKAKANTSIFHFDELFIPDTWPVEL